MTYETNPSYQPASADPERCEEYLDTLRQQGDPLADQLIAELLASGQYRNVRQALSTLERNDTPVDPALPSNLRDYLQATGELPSWAEPELLRRGAATFLRHGPCILMMLGCYSLPADFAARRGVQVLFRTGELMGNTTRRILETTQMIVDVLEPGGLQAKGRGIRTVQKVRLIHALVRARLLGDLTRPWDQTLGLPINQEDMAGTLLSFSTVVLDGFNKLNAPLPQDTAEAFVHTWKVIGWLMGVRRELLPRDLDDAWRLSDLIRGRQFGASAEGQQLTRELVKMMEYNTPGTLFDGFPTTLMHHFLGDEIAGMLGLPPPDWTARLIQWGQWLGKLHMDLDDRSRVCARLSERFAHAYVYGLLHTQIDPKRPPFTLPAIVQQSWGLPVAAYQLADQLQPAPFTVRAD